MNKDIKKEKDFYIMINTTAIYSRIIVNILVNFLRRNNGKCLVIEGVPLNKTDIIKYLDETDKEEYINGDMKARVQFKVPGQKSIQEIINLGASLSANDTLIIAGFERFIPELKLKSQGTVKYNNLKIRTFIKAEIDWSGLNEEIELLRTIDTNRVILLNCEAVSKDALFKNIEQGDWDIFTCENEETEEDRKVYDFQIEILNSIGKVEKEELIKCINENTMLPLAQKAILKAHIYVLNHDRAEAIKILGSQYDSLQLEQKRMYADLLDSVGRSGDALTILEDILKKDCLVHDVWPSVLKASRHARCAKFTEYMQCALRFDPQNVKVLTEAANYYVNEREFSEAAKYWHAIFVRNNEPYYEMMARVSEIEGDHSRPLQDALDYIQGIADKYPELQGEVNYRNGRIAFELYGSAYKGYELLSKVTDGNDENAYKAATIRMDILQNPAQAIRAEKRAKKRPDVLAKLKLEELYRSMDALCKAEQGAGRWQEFIEKAQSEEAWNQVITENLVFWLKSGITDSLLYISDTPEYGEEKDNSQAAKAINLFRCNKSMAVIPVSDVDEVIKGSYYCLFYKKSTIRQKIWYWYELSVMYALLGRGQDAINAALQLLQYAESVPQAGDKNLGYVLGFLAWGHAQFRLGSKVEGMICILHALHSFKRKTGTSFFIEEVLNVIVSWIATNTAANSESRVTCQRFLNSIHDKYPKMDIIEITSHMLDEDMSKAYLRLKLAINSAKVRDSTWMAHFANYITACIQTGKIPEAKEVIRRYAETVLPLLNYRGDLKASLLNSWAQVFIQGTTVEDVRMAEKLIDIAVQSVENKRIGIAFRTERAGFADISRKVYKTYLDVQGLVIQLNGFSGKEKLRARNKIFQALNALAPRSILESVSEAACSYSDVEWKELGKIAQRYRTLRDELNCSAMLHGLSNTEEKAKECMKLLDILKKRHPEYKALPVIVGIHPEAVVESLAEGEVVYQYVQTNYGMAYFLADNKNWDAGLILLEVKKVNKMLRELADHMQNFSGSVDMKYIEDICYEISRTMHQPLLSRLESDDIDRVLICPDMSLPLYSSNLIKSKSDWLIERVDSIINIIGLNKLIERDTFKEDSLKKSLVIALGKKDDKAIKIARTWAEEYADELRFQAIDDLNQSFENIVRTIQETEASTVVIIGHGVPDTLSNALSGAMYIDSNHGAVWTEDLMRMKQNVSNIILITCSSGTPQMGLVESGDSVWNGMMRAAFSGTILCRWDVDVRSSTDIVRNIFKARNSKLAAGLIYAQRKTGKTEKWAHPVYWAALEYWMN